MGVGLGFFALDTFNHSIIRDDTIDEPHWMFSPWSSGQSGHGLHSVNSPLVLTFTKFWVNEHGGWPSTTVAIIQRRNRRWIVFWNEKFKWRQNNRLFYKFAKAVKEIQLLNTLSSDIFDDLEFREKPLNSEGYKFFPVQLSVLPFLEQSPEAVITIMHGTTIILTVLRLAFDIRSDSTICSICSARKSTPGSLCQLPTNNIA